MTHPRYRGRPEPDPRPRRLWLVTDAQPGMALEGRLWLVLAWVVLGLMGWLVVLALGWVMAMGLRWAGL